MQRCWWAELGDSEKLAEQTALGSLPHSAHTLLIGGASEFVAGMNMPPFCHRIYGLCDISGDYVKDPLPAKLNDELKSCCEWK